MNKPQATKPENETIEYGYGWKALDPTGCTHYSGDEYQYSLPRPGEKWGPVNVHPDPAEPNGMDCGPGRFHVHNKPTYLYGPPQCWLWYARYPKSAIVGSSAEKTGVTQLQLRRVSRKVFFRMIRLGWLRDADLYGANLGDANLRGADLRGANLRDADLHGAYLRDANLGDANLYDANLYGANLRGAYLGDANLYGANLRGAYLRGANLYGANLYGADLRGANLRDADLRGAYLRGANLYGANFSQYTQLPNGQQWAVETDMTIFTETQS